MAKYFDARNGYSDADLMEAANSIKNGKLVLFPTETVYGIGANGLDEEAVKSIFVAKGRKQDNPLILHVSSVDMVDMIAEDIGDIERKLMENFFPGPLTIILKKKKIVPYIVTGGGETVGVRMPSSDIARDLIRLSGVPIAAPSANISGKPSGTNVNDIFNELESKVDYIIDGGQTKIGVESTVIIVINGKIRILRPGKICKDDFEKIGFEVEIDNHVMNDINDNTPILSPGMKYKHYAPNSKCLLIYSEDNDKFINKVKELEKTQNILVLTRTSNCPYFKKTLDLGESLDEISHNIFTLLRKVDDYNCDLVVIEGVKCEGLGLAIMNRLIRACSHNFINL